MISVITANWWAKDFAQLQYRSLCKYLDDFELLIVDNSGELTKADFPNAENVSILKPNKNLGHAGGLDYLLPLAASNTIMVLDVDTHLVGGSQELFEKLAKEHGYLPGQGGHLKPVRPCCAMLNRDLFIKNKISFRPRKFEDVKFDVGVWAWFDAQSHGAKVALFDYMRTEYKDVVGNEYGWKKQRLFYHQWYGTRWYNKDGKQVHKVIDGHTFEKFEASKKLLMEQTKDLIK